MYSLAEKNRVIQLFKKEESIESIRLKSNISKSTLYRWKAQYERAKEKSKQVKEYINEGKLEEAENLAKEILKSSPIYKKQWDEVERLAKERFKLEPRDLVARCQLDTIVKQKVRWSWDEAEGLKKEISGFIGEFRNKVYDGEITIENLSDYEKQLAGLPPFEQKMLLAEAYAHWNMATNATKLLKEAASTENISERQQKILKQAMQISKSKSSTPIAKRKQWSILNGNGEGR